MNIKKEYTKPVIEVIDLYTEHIMAQSSEFNLNGEHNGGNGGAAGARERGFWNN